MIGIVLAGLLIISFLAVIISALVVPYSDYDRMIDDEMQMKYLKETSKKGVKNDD